MKEVFHLSHGLSCVKTHAATEAVINSAKRFPEITDSENPAESVDEVGSSGIQNVGDEGVAGGIVSGSKLTSNGVFKSGFLGVEKRLFDRLKRLFCVLDAFRTQNWL